MKKYIDRNRREAVEYKVRNRMLLNKIRKCSRT